MSNKTAETPKLTSQSPPSVPTAAIRRKPLPPGFQLQKPLPPIPAGEAIHLDLSPKSSLPDLSYNVYLASFFTKFSDRYMIFVETNLRHKSGWIFHVHGPNENNLVYESRKSDRPIRINPHQCHMDYLGYIAKRQFDMVDELLRKSRPPGTWTNGQTIINLPSLRYEDSWDWCQKAIEILHRNGVLWREKDESKNEPEERY